MRWISWMPWRPNRRGGWPDQQTQQFNGGGGKTTNLRPQAVWATKNDATLNVQILVSEVFRTAASKVWLVSRHFHVLHLLIAMFYSDYGTNNSWNILFMFSRL